MKQPQQLIGQSQVLADTLQQVSQIAPLQRPVLIIGERGTGKELVAERLHFLSTRWQQPFLKVNCAAISDNLLDADLFGYEPGAFTGATRIYRGRFERADEGTLFLDELATMSTRLQEKLLRVIEYGEFERLGGKSTLQANVRVLAATNEDLPHLARSGQFREDLLDRLAFDVVSVPPLRARGEDIELLADHFAIRMSAELAWPQFPGFTAKAMQQLQRLPFPGNIRELKNIVERSVYRWDNPAKPVAQLVIDPFVTPWQIAPTLKDGQPQSADMIRKKIKQNFMAEVAQFETQLLQQALDANEQHQGKAAAALGLTYHQFRAKLKKHRLL